MGVHSNKDGEIAIYGYGTEEYKRIVNDQTFAKVKDMKSSKYRI
ncbi:hypothetical protein LEP1GSC203_0789 [Leptospira terpstrae serovar Hualin str. LT 11-33 = ATCC 700639]|uniref:Uncharacterized protein n=1 Tax=Leptospira terpstrae serovar Hualin str. LT 11-33 = ATCC 700639 TaxID=1257025 RepID=N1VKC1_9LEPT|nr:hypothetical protein LEP1GSC203_0789 [Leptospira terpstrae serovar Hualin str. LT 11-33 = ATCC 700639]